MSVQSNVMGLRKLWICGCSHVQNADADADWFLCAVYFGEAGLRYRKIA